MYSIITLNQNAQTIKNSLNVILLIC